MAVLCERCGRKTLVKNIGEERNTWALAGMGDARPTYICRECIEERSAQKIKETRRALGLEAPEADS